MNNKSLISVGELSLRYSDHPLIRSLLSLLPGWSAADTLIQERTNQLRRENLKTFFDELVDGQIDLTEEIVQSNEFLFCYFKTIRASIETTRKEKIRMLAKLIKNYEQFSGSDHYEEFLSILDTITYREFCVLELLLKYESEADIEEKENPLAVANSFWEAFKYNACKTYNIKPEEFGSFLVRLQRTGLYSEITGSYVGYVGGRGVTTPLFRSFREMVKTA